MKIISTLSAYLALFRIPIVFTAMSNVYAGYLIGGGAFFSLKLVIGLAATSFFIMAGMGLNDVADSKTDLRERPNRPIPSGAVSLTGAKAISISLIAVALFMLALTKLSAVLPGALLCYCIYLYNFILKHGRYGPAVMGACRVLNFILGISLGLGESSFWTRMEGAWLFIFISLGFFVGLITYLARGEVGGNTREKIHKFLILLLSWMGCWLLGFVLFVPGFQKPAGLVVLAVMAGFLLPFLLALMRNPDGAVTRKSVARLLACIPMVDVMAMLMVGIALTPALAGLAFPVLFLLAGRYFNPA